MKIVFNTRGSKNAKELIYSGDKPATVKEGMAISLAKWQIIARSDVLIEDNGTETCGLCMLYFEEACHGCPIRAHTGKSGCVGTPYAGYVDAWEDGNHEQAQMQAKLMLTFLKGLAPNGSAA